MKYLTLRMKVRNAIRECFRTTWPSIANETTGLEYRLVDAVFEALEITENEVSDVRKI